MRFHRRRVELRAAYIVVRDRVLHPRAMLATSAGLYLLVGWQTVADRPDWLAYATLWAAVAGVAGITALVALIYPARIVVVTAGATSVVAAFARAFALSREMAFEGQTEQQFATYSVAAAVWAALAVLHWQAFSAVVVPWAARRREVAHDARG